MEENKDALLVMVRNLNEWFAKKIKKAEFDRTLFGTVTAVTENGYEVSIAGRKYIVRGNGTEIPVRTQVRVKLPCNQWTQAYIESIVY